MSEKIDTQMTHTVGFFNPHTHPIYFEISSLGIKVNLPPGKYIKDQEGNLLNDPIFEEYCHPKGISKATSDAPVPVRLVPRVVASTRPNHAVTDANSFVRQPDGRVIPVYGQPSATPAPIPMNHNPVIGMTVEAARKAGFIGAKARLVPEDFGADETSGAPMTGKRLPDIKVSIESPPKLRTAAPLTPDMMIADERLSPAEIARRASLQQSLTTAAASGNPENFRPESIKPIATAPVSIKAPKVPSVIVSGQPVPITPRSVVAETAKGRPGRIRTVKVEPPAPVVPQEEETQNIESTVEIQDESSIQPIGEESSGPINNEPSGRFLCLADGKQFEFRSYLERHVKKNFPHLSEELMKPYPPG